jgi:GT2 family glycosyltransferase
MPSAGRGLRIGFVEPHLQRFGGIRRMVEFANRLVARGHQVTFYLPERAEMRCLWMRCDAAVKPIKTGFGDPLDIVLFNHEPQWHLLDRFERARRRVFYALHDGALYNKEGSWESVHAAVDLQLANSNWTADQIAAATGHRPTVQLGGVNREVFQPYPGPKRYPLLCSGEQQRAWKGTDTILEAGARLGIPVARYSGKNLEQHALGREYAAARVFAVGSWFEGFCQPGLEALACGTPLVTTDNGGCREYAVDGETALVVPPRDVHAMADAVQRLLDDDALAARLVANGLDVVERDFDWEKRTDEFETVLDGLSAGPASSPPPARPAVPTEPELSVVVLAWDNFLYTQQFSDSVRRNTDVPYELVIVDNGSEWEAANYARAAADRVVLNSTNLGFARGMNQGLAAARGRYVAFCNNDTILPPDWASHLVQTARSHPNAAVVVPAVTTANNQVNVRTEPGDKIEVLPPFSAPPAAIIWVMPNAIVRELGAWGEEYEIASGEDVDLAFKAWVNDLDVVYDQRVLVQHVGHGTSSRLDDQPGLWARNRRRFLEKWKGDDQVPRLASCDPQRFARNRETARAVAGWMERYFTVRDREDRRLRRLFAKDGPVRTILFGWAHAGWRKARPRLPARIADRLGSAARRVE